MYRTVYRRKNLAETTKDNYNTRLKRIVKHPLGKKKLVSVKKIDITRYMDEIEREGILNNRSINGDWRLLQTIFNYAIDCGYISQNVVNSTTKKQEETFEGTALTKEEVQALMQAIDDCQDKRLKVIVCLGALQGMRRGEILGLKWEDITTGADEHYYVHRMRNHPHFIPELAFVLELDGRKWMYIPSAAVEAFDATFPPKEKKWMPSQEELYIYSHSSVVR